MAEKQRASSGTITLERPRKAPRVDWSLLSAQGKVLFYMAMCPRCTVEQMANGLGMTERAVWGVVRELRRDNMLILEKDGRRHRYSVNLDAPLLHPTIRGLTLRPVLGAVVAQGERDRSPICEPDH